MSLFKSKFLKSENILKNIYYILMTNIKPVVNLYWLQNAAQQISENKLTVADAAKNAHFNLNQYLYINPISPATLRKLFAEYNITYYTQKGRKPFEMTEEIENLILYFQSYLNSGEKVTFYSIILEYPNIPFIAVRQTFIKFHLYKYKKPQKKKNLVAVMRPNFVIKFGMPIYIIIKKIIWNQCNIYMPLWTINQDLSLVMDF